MMVSAAAATARRGFRLTRAFAAHSPQSLLRSATVAPSISIAAATSTLTQPLIVRELSTSPHKQSTTTSSQLVQLPPNLKIDKRSKVSPFYGLEPVSLVHEKKREDEEKQQDDAIPQQDVVVAKGEQDDGYDSDISGEEDEDSGGSELWYDVSQSALRRQPLQAIPLPQRLHVSVYNKNDITEAVGTIHLDERVFGHSPIRVDLIKRAVQYQRNKKRGKRFPAKTKTISEVSGSGRKVRQQKGTGKARAGHSRPPHWRGGAKAHGPKGVMQDYTTKLNKKVRKLALMHVLSQKLLEQNLLLLNDLRLETYKTGQLAKMLKNMENIGGRRGQSALLMDAVDDNNKTQNSDEALAVDNGLPVHLIVAAANIPNIKVLHPNYANVYDILKHGKLVLTLAGLEALEQRLLRK
jgi:large subunit ribosomal protein L4